MGVLEAIKTPGFLKEDWLLYKKELWLNGDVDVDFNLKMQNINNKQN